jgi:ANTAR domain-containing protein/GAF domain-containing protein
MPEGGGYAMDAADPQGARARFLNALESLEARGDEPAQLCRAAALSLSVARAAIAVHVDGPGLEVLCATDEVAEQVEWAQITLGEGPGVDAVATGGPVLVPDVSSRDDQWPAFAPEAVKAGVGALYALPLELGAIRVGVLNLYRDEPAPLDGKDFADCVIVAELITAILLTVEGTGRLTDGLGPWWDQPLSTREVHQATGMIMAQLEVTARAAYVRMQAYAYAQDRMLSEVAHAVVNRILRFDPDPMADPDEVSAQQ